MRPRASIFLLVLLAAGLAGGSCARRCGDAAAEAELAAQNVRLVRSTVEDGYNARNPAAFDAAYHPHAVVWNNGQLLDDGPILDGFRRDLLRYDQQFSEWRIDVDDIFATADRVAVRWTFHGRLRHNGQQVSSTGNWIGRIHGGKVVEVWEATDE